MQLSHPCAVPVVSLVRVLFTCFPHRLDADLAEEAVEALKKGAASK
jgi:hypothetical protein